METELIRTSFGRRWGVVVWTLRR